jgi:hypothetical protein
MVRNQLVHSSTLDHKRVEYAVDLAQDLLLKLEANIDRFRAQANRHFLSDRCRD